MRPWATTMACVLSATLALAAGCGGGDEPNDARQVVREFVTAVNERDGEAFCNEITTREYVEKVTAATGDGAVKQCERQISRISQPELRVVRLDRAKADGDRVTVSARLEQEGEVQRQVFHLVEEDGEFRLTSGATD